MRTRAASGHIPLLPARRTVRLCSSRALFLMVLAGSSLGCLVHNTLSSPATTMDPDEKANLIIKKMTLDEKIQLTHGELARSIWPTFPIIYWAPRRSLGGAGFVPGIPRLGIPDLQIVDAGAGLTAGTLPAGGHRTILPSPIAVAATWNPTLADQYGTVIGREARAAGFNVALGGEVNLVREPRSGRVFETYGEDPLLAGTMVASQLKATQAQHVIASIKHFALNDQETGRFGLSANLDERSLRETDLLAFELGIAGSGVGTVMCAYNRINGVYACENAHLISDILKKEWGFKGWVISDWGATRSTVPAALAGLDQEQPFAIYFGERLKQAVLARSVPETRLNDMVHRILRTLYTVGVDSRRPTTSPPSGAPVARQVEHEAAVLLRNTEGILPLNASHLRSIAVIGSHADVAVLSGGGSSQSMPPGGSPVPTSSPKSEHFDTMLLTAKEIWLPSSPLDAIRRKAPHAEVRFSSGEDIEAARSLAGRSDIAIVFAHQWRTEGLDLDSLSLPGQQDELIQAVGGANRNTIVVLETGGAVLMPWLNKVKAVLEAWYPGPMGGDAIADILFGAVNPSGKLPVTFPARDADLPHPTIAQPPRSDTFFDMAVRPFFRMDSHPAQFDVDYSEGLEVGYKWYDAKHLTPLFPFGYGLSYTTFDYSELRTFPRGDHRVQFLVKNTGTRKGAEVAQVYLRMPEDAHEPTKRLIGWKKVELGPGEVQKIDCMIDPRMLSIYDAEQKRWRIVRGRYTVLVGSSSRDLPLSAVVDLGQ